MLDKNHIPVLPFENFKWKWACLQCTEGLNDPVVLLGVLFRMRKLEPLNIKYSSNEFAQELVELSNDIQDSIGIDLSGRTGERNIIRNSGQYWRAVNLISSGDHSGLIKLTDFGRKVADHEISQTEFAAITIQTFQLPNHIIQSSQEYNQWLSFNLSFHPLKLILAILVKLSRVQNNSYITVEELIRIIIPLSGENANIDDYVNFIMWYRLGDISLSGWPNCCNGANDIKIAREFLLFLSNYGYINQTTGSNRLSEKYEINQIILPEIIAIVSQLDNISGKPIIEELRESQLASEIERKRLQSYKRTSRPNQARFRSEVLNNCKRCVITNVTMPEVLEAAHIKPFKYNGEDTVANGFAMRTDIHILFDSGHMRIREDGIIDLSSKARMDYGASIPPQIVIPNFTNREFLRWRWDNYNGY